MFHLRSICSIAARIHVNALWVVLAVAALATRAPAQYTTATGTPTFTTAVPVEMGFTNVANGNLHIEIPLASFPQRGSLTYNARLVYDSLIWTVQNNTWSPTNVPNSMGGWRLITGGEPGTVTSITSNKACDTPPPIQFRTVHTGFVWTAPDGTSHRFPIFTMRDTTICQEGITSDTEMADDSSGFTMSVTNYDSATVYAPDGTQVYPTVMDTNGNFFSQDGAGQIIDTLGRTPITVTPNGNTITFNVLNTLGTRTAITVTTTTVSASTAFGQSGVAECQTSCSFTAIQSIAFADGTPDGTRYSFTYDSGTTSGHFGVLKGMTLRAGGTISYGYTTFADIQGNHSRWLSSKMTGTDTWNYTPHAQALTANQVIVEAPSGDHIDYAFDLNNGAWVSSATYVDATRGVLLYVTSTWDTSNGCPQNSGCSGAAFVRRMTSSTQFPDGLKKTVTYFYTSPVTGQVSEIDESDYSTGTPPILRKTLFTYASLGNIISKPATITIEDGASPPNIASQTKFTYDEPSYCCTLTTGTPQHVAVNVARGNATTTASLVSGNTYLTTHRSYYDTGTLNTNTDSKGNLTTFNYSDSTATCGNSFPTSVTFPLGLSTSTTWNCSTSLAASTKDANNQITSYSYDGMNRLIQTTRPDNVQLNTHFNDTASPPNIAQSTTANSAASVNSSDELGRVVQTQLLNGTTPLSTTSTQIDALHNTVKTSNPYGPADSPQWKTTVTDLLGRPLTVSPPSGGSYQYNYSDNAITITDPVGNQRRSFSDGLGRLIEVDEPGDSYPGIKATGSTSVTGALQNHPQGGAKATGTVTISGTERTYQDRSDCNIVNGHLVCATAPDNGTVWISVNGVKETYFFGDGDTANSVAFQLTSSFNTDPASPVNATLSGTTITLTSKVVGSSTNYALSVGQTSHASSFIPAASGATLTGGADGPTIYDSGTVTLAVSGFTATAPYGQSTNSTAAAVAAALVGTGPTGLNRAGSPVSAAVSGATISITYNTPGQGGDVSVAITSSTGDPADFSAGSFCSPQCTSTLAGGDNPEAPSLDRNSYVTKYTYDTLDNLTKVSQGVQTRTYNYDELGRITSSTMPESGTMTYSYVAADGSLCSGNTSLPCYTTDARGVITTNTYDGLNRLTQVSYNVGSTGVPATPAVSYTYGGDAGSNNNGRLLTMTDGVGSETNTYDLMGRITNVARSIGGATYNIGYGYNSADQITSITYPSTRVVQQGYDSAGRLTSIASAETTYVSVAPTNGFNASQQPLNISYGSGVTGAFGYNDHLQMSSLAYTEGSNTLLNLGYSYSDANGDNNGKIQGITDVRGPAFSTSYTYDVLGRLSQAQTVDLSAANTWQLAWNYDRYGNRLSQTLTGGTIAAGQPQLNVDPNSNRISTAGFVYDASGNLAQDPLYTYAYNAEGELANVNGTGPAYAYDGHRWRVQKTVSGTTTTYIYAASKVIAEYANGSLSKEYIYSGGRLLATIAGGAVTYHYPDHLSNRLETDAAGNVTRTFGHLPFGETWYETGTPDKWKFTGYERDSAESKLDYALNRFYASNYGRFQSPDSMPGTAADPQSLNRFAYVTNDPGNQVDPDGRCGLIVAGINMDPDTQSGQDLIATAAQLGVNVAFPFDANGKLAGIGDVFNEGVGLDTPADDVTSNAIQASNQHDGNGVQILGYSGGAATTSAVLNSNQALADTVTLVDYFSPGVINGSLFQTKNGSGTQQTFMARGDGFFDGLVNLTTAGQGHKTQIRGVGHNLNRALASGTDAAARLMDDVSQNACDAPTVFSTRNPKGAPNRGSGGGGGTGLMWVLSWCDDSGCTVLAMWPA
jgi:RHS repeat-associated protein